MTMNTSVPRIDHPKKNRIRRAFGRNPSYYHEHADVQRESAQRLMASLEPWKAIIPKGRLLEIGCGTGFISKQLIQMFPGREIEISDISDRMLSCCRTHLKEWADQERINLRVRDGEYLETNDEQFGLIVHNFVAQWFKDTALSLERMVECLKPGGLLLAAFPGNRSFPEWREAAREAKVSYTGNQLPDTEEIVVKLSRGPVQVDYFEDDITNQFDSVFNFFRHLKKIGASTPEEDQKLNPSELKRLASQWEQNADADQIYAQYHVVFVAAKKD